MERLPVTARPEEEAHILAGMLAGDLADWPTEAWLVFDDYHVIAGMLAAEQFFETLLVEAPVNVLVITRRRQGGRPRVGFFTARWWKSTDRRLQ
jgi:ATP/maltotriose-dependent transcriptional regulator MalT